MTVTAATAVAATDRLAGALGLGWRPEVASLVLGHAELSFVEVTAESLSAGRPLPLALDAVRRRGLAVIPHAASLSLTRDTLCSMSLPLSTTEAAPVRAAVYCRISSDPQGLRAGVRRQEDDGRTYCKAHGWTVAGVFIDNDISAYSGKPRPEYRRMLAEIEAGEVNAVVVWHPDRLHRSPAELEDFITLVERTGCAVGTVTAGNYDLTMPAGRMTARVVGAVARGESEHKSERNRRKAKQLAEEGKVGGGGTRPFGYEADRLTVNEPEAVLIRQAAQDVLAGVSMRSIAMGWNAAKVTTPAGKPWRVASLDRMLRSARIAGLRSHHGAVVADAIWPAIIDRATWEAVKAVLGELNRFPGRNTRSYLLSGYVFCGLCGARIVARPHGARSYVCASDPGLDGCGKIRRMADPVEGLVSSAVMEALSGRGMAQALQDHSSEQKDVRGLVDALEGYEARLVALEAEFMDGGLDLATWKRMKAGLVERIMEARKALAQKTNRAVAMDIPVGVRLEDWWETASLDRRRALVQMAVEKVIINPAVKGRNFFDPSRIEIVWKG